MRTVIIHGKRVSTESPRAGRPECALWGVTRGNVMFWKGQLLDWTAWFDMHPLAQNRYFTGIPQRRPEAWQWMRRQDGSRPIYLQAPEAHPPEHQEEAARLFAQVPGAQRFPLADVQAAFPINGQPNTKFICQMGLMMAFAAFSGYERVILNGVGTSSRADFQIAHLDTEYWLGFLRGRGIVVEIEGPSTHHAPRHVYAYERFNFAEVDAARREAQDAAIDTTSMEQTNERETRRGRPARFRVPPPRT